MEQRSTGGHIQRGTVTRQNTDTLVTLTATISKGAANGKKCTVLVYEKYYFRVKNYVTLTVVLDNFDGKTRVHMVGSGGGNGLLNLDFCASNSFVSKVMDRLEQYKI